MMYVVLDYKYNEYQIYKYTQSLIEFNAQAQEKTQEAQRILINRSTKAYKNKIIKSQLNKKNPGEEVIFLIEEEKYNKYTQNVAANPARIVTSQNLLDEKSLISTMTNYQKWVYLILDKDIR